MRKTFDELQAQAPATHPKVLLVHNREAGTLGSFYSVGSKSFQHDLITIAGGQNLFADVASETIQPTLEEVISRRPEIIIETLPPPVKPGRRRSTKEGLGRPGPRQRPDLRGRRVLFAGAGTATFARGEADFRNHSQRTVASEGRPFPMRRNAVRRHPNFKVRQTRRF